MVFNLKIQFCACFFANGIFIALVTQGDILINDNGIAPLKVYLRCWSGSEERKTKVLERMLWDTLFHGGVEENVGRRRVYLFWKKHFDFMIVKLEPVARTSNLTECSVVTTIQGAIMV